MLEQQQFKHVWAEAIKAANNSPGFKSAKVKGFAAILYGLAMNKRSGIKIGDSSYIKYWTPFMLRNGFRPFFDNLNVDGLKELQNIDRTYLDTNMFPNLAEATISDMYNEVASYEEESGGV